MQYSLVVEALLTAGANTESCLHYKTSLLVAAGTGDVATARVLWRKGALTDAIDDRSQTALLLAATIGHHTMVSLLVDSGANKEAADKYEQTALHHTASNGHDSSVQLLIGTLGVDRKAMDNNQRTALLPGRSDLDGD